MQRLAILSFVLIAFSLTGCPDYSHLREVPDYENMKDGGGPGQLEQFDAEEDSEA